MALPLRSSTMADERRSADDGRIWLRRALVGVEMALATALLASAALLLHSFVKVMNADRGYVIDSLLTPISAIRPPLR